MTSIVLNRQFHTLLGLANIMTLSYETSRKIISGYELYLDELTLTSVSRIIPLLLELSLPVS